MGYSPPPKNNFAHYLNLSDAVNLGYGAYSTLRKYIADGRLPSTKIGGRVKVLRTDLDALADSRASSSNDVEAAIERIVASAPPLTEDQTHRLAVLLGGTS